MRNPTAPADASRTTQRKLSRQTGATAPAKAPRSARKPAPHDGQDGPDASDQALALELSASSALLEGPSREALIRVRAYERYERNGRAEGKDLDDWLAAEAEVGAMFSDGAGRTASAAAPCE